MKKIKELFNWLFFPINLALFLITLPMMIKILNDAVEENLKELEKELDEYYGDR